MIDAVDAGLPLPKISVPEAMKMVAEAWDTVSADTIKKCWAMTKVKEDPEFDHLQKSIRELEKHTRLESLSAEQFVTADATIQTCQEKTEDDFIKEIKRSMSGEDSTDEEDDEATADDSWEPPLRGALAGAIVLEEYLRFFDFPENDLMLLGRLKEELQKKRVASMQQTTITSFFSKE